MHSHALRFEFLLFPFIKPPQTICSYNLLRIKTEKGFMIRQKSLFSSSTPGFIDRYLFENFLGMLTFFVLIPNGDFLFLQYNFAVLVFLIQFPAQSSPV